MDKLPEVRVCACVAVFGVPTGSPVGGGGGKPGSHDAARRLKAARALCPHPSAVNPLQVFIVHINRTAWQLHGKKEKLKHKVAVRSCCPQGADLFVPISVEPV